MKRMFQRRFLIFGGLIVADGLFFGLTSPTKLPQVVLIFSFLLLALSIYCLFKLLFRLISLYGWEAKGGARRLSRLMAGIFIGILALQSIGELTSRDIIVLLPLVVIMYMYLTYGRDEATN